jgi:hypothetical protein
MSLLLISNRLFPFLFKKKKNEKACFSRVGRTHPHDYAVSFSDTQELQYCYRKLLKAQNAIGSALDVASGLTSHCKQLVDLAVLPTGFEVLLQLELYTARLKNHKDSIVSLVAYSQGVSNLV